MRGAAVAGGLLDLAHGHSGFYCAASERFTGVVIGQRENGAGVTLTQLAGGEQLEHLVGQLEQA